MPGLPKRLNQGFQELKAGLKCASIEAIERDAFAKSRQLTEIMERLRELETRTSGIFGGMSSTTTVGGATPEENKTRYPRFFRIGQTLYKEGMRQDGKSIYTQKVDRGAFEEIVAAVATRKGRKFKPGDVIGQVEQPSYQVYIVLNVLQNAGLVKNPERGSYQVTGKTAITEVAALWNNIEHETVQ